MQTTVSGPPSMPRRGEAVLVGATLTAVILIAWLLVLFAPDGTGMGLLAFTAAWTIMMAAMMLPSAAPLVLLHRLGASPGATSRLVAGYLAVWGATGLPAWLAMETMPMSLSPAVLAIAGIYQFTPLKTVCLRKCRTPADFLMQRWGRGPFRLGLEHGLWCLGCCWALMAVLVLVGMMGLAWVAGLAAVVAIEKMSRYGVHFSRLAGIAFLTAALYEVFR